MATLNYNWQLIGEAGGTLNGYTCNLRLYAKLLWQNTANNQSGVAYESRLYYGGSYFETGSPSSKSIVATSVSGQSADARGTYNSGENTLFTVSGIVTHDNNTGNANISANATVNFGPWGYSNSVTGSASLPRIPRFATMTSASNFNDEENPSFTFDNPANTSMSCWLEPKPSGPHIAERNFSGKNGTFTWNDLTEAERDQLRARCKDGKSCKCRIGLYSTIGSTRQPSYKDVTMTIVNADPIFSDFDFEDINTTTLALTGNNKYNINGYSTIKVSISPQNKAIAQKGADMVKYQLIIGNNDPTYIDYDPTNTVEMKITNASAGEFKVYAIDSRGNSTLVTKTATQIINYEPLFLDRANSEVTRSDGGIGEDVTLSYQGGIWNNSFGQVTNTLTIAKYEFKKVSDSTWITGTTNIMPTITDNVMSFNGLIRSNENDYKFPVEESYNFRIILQDKLSAIIVELTPLPSGTPNISLNKNGVGIMCDYDESLGGLLQVGGEVYTSDKGTILWQNSSPSSNFTAKNITLSSDDYDVLEIWFKNNASQDNITSQKIIKGYSAFLECNIRANNTTYHRHRFFTRTNDTTYNVSSGYQQTTNSGSYSQADSSIVPVYIIGYKTNLF